MAEPTHALQVALLARLKGILSCAVYDAVPQGAAYPYVTLDAQTADAGRFLTLRTTTRFVYLGIWSQVYGQGEILKIMGQLDALHEQPLTLSTGSVISVRVERTRTVRESDNLTYMGQVTLRIMTQH